MADMSPEAVTQRLRLMDELWELSVALVNAKEVSPSERPLENTQARPQERDTETSQSRKR
jgi:hypothetical protein